MKNKLFYFLFLCSLAETFVSNAKDYKLVSPDKRIRVSVQIDRQIAWSVTHDKQVILSPSVIGLTVENARHKVESLGNSPKVVSSRVKQTNSQIHTSFYKKRTVSNEYNGLVLQFAGDYSLEFRAYDEGVSYRFATARKDSFLVKNEQAEFQFPHDAECVIPYVNDLRSRDAYTYSFESYYDFTTLSAAHKDSLMITPLSVSPQNGVRATIMETAVNQYPGMFLSVKPDAPHKLVASFAAVPEKTEIGGYNRLNIVPVKRAEYIAKVSGKHQFPWRVLLITDDDRKLGNNDMALKLGDTPAIDDLSWIQPGKSAWEWWNNSNLRGVDFVAGVNTDTYKAYIDFAASRRLQYVVIDEGWSKVGNLLTMRTPDINVEELATYAKDKQVGIILWASWQDIIKNTDVVMSHYAQMGIKGFKIDFFDRNDQTVNASVEEIARCAAKHHLILDLHGYTANGIQFKYPNILNFEGVKGLENMKWAAIANGAPVIDVPQYDVTIPFLRMLSGPMDYTPGAMDNATRQTFRTISENPMSQGTRVHQMAMYVVYDGALQMMADTPYKYIREPECTDFIAQIPTTFDETVAVNASLGEYITLAKKKGDDWYIGALTNWTARTLDLDLSFLPKGRYQMEIFKDGVNADRNATDYVRELRTIDSAEQLKIALKPGGGWVARLTVKH